MKSDWLQKIGLIHSFGLSVEGLSVVESELRDHFFALQLSFFSFSKAIIGYMLSDWSLVAVHSVQSAVLTGFKQLGKYCIKPNIYRNFYCR